MNKFLKILGAASAVVATLITAGVVPAWAAVIPTVVGIVSGTLHPSPAATKAFGTEAK